MAKWHRQKQVARAPKRRSWKLNNMSVRMVKLQRRKSGHDSMTPLVTRGSNSNTNTMNDVGERPGRVRGETPEAVIWSCRCWRNSGPLKMNRNTTTFCIDLFYRTLFFHQLYKKPWVSLVNLPCFYYEPFVLMLLMETYLRTPHPTMTSLTTYWAQWVCWDMRAKQHASRSSRRILVDRTADAYPSWACHRHVVDSHQSIYIDGTIRTKSAQILRCVDEVC